MLIGIMAFVMVTLPTHEAIFDVQAQQPSSAGQQPAKPSGWTVRIAPYGWMPKVNMTNEFNLPPARHDSSSASGAIEQSNGNLRYLSVNGKMIMANLTLQLEGQRIETRTR